jgi:thiamine-phosphate pyrophosphorylase
MATNFQPPRFYPIIDTAVVRATAFSAVGVAEAAAAAGVNILQYRHKDKWTQFEFDEAKTIAAICRDADILFVVNDRADFAQLLGAALHIGQDDLPPPAARRVVAEAVIGFSTHNAGQLRRAAGMPVDYLSLGPIFTTTSKERPDPVVGLEGLKTLRALTEKPLVAIGGITLENAAEVLAAGADSVAIISGILPAEQDRLPLRQRLSDLIRATNAA